MSPSPEPSTAPANRHAPTAVERQRIQLEKLLKDPAKPAYIPPAPKDKSLRPAREMMKNVQGSSAGAGSGEFHVYKASRRREYERLKLLEDESAKETEIREFEQKRKLAEETAEAKTAKNRAKRQKKKDARSKTVKPAEASRTDTNSSVPFKKRRLVNGDALVFKRPGESDDEDEGDTGPQLPSTVTADTDLGPLEPPKTAEEAKIVIHEDD